MAFDLYETHELLRVLDNNGPEETEYFMQFFPSEHRSQKESIDFDLLDKTRRLAPFVAPNVQGQPMVQRGYSTRSFKPAYSKPKHLLDPNRIVRRRAGEAYGGTMSLAQRENAIIADTLLEQSEMIRRRWHWMCAEAVTKGSVTVEGENYPSVTLDFGRNPDNTVVMSGPRLWSNPTTARPLDDIKAWARQIQRSGRKARRLTLGLNASTAFFATDQVKAEFETRRGAVITDSFVRNNLSGDSVVFHGPVEGGIEVVTFSDFYEDNMGEEQEYLDPDTVLLTGDVDGVRAFGAIMDRKAGYQSLPIFAKMWEQDDPSGLALMSQSAPLMVPLNPNASLWARVL